MPFEAQFRLAGGVPKEWRKQNSYLLCANHLPTGQSAFSFTYNLAPYTQRYMNPHEIHKFTNLPIQKLQNILEYALKYLHPEIRFLSVNN
jgi:hypothetical protein